MTPCPAKTPSSGDVTASRLQDASRKEAPHRGEAVSVFPINGHHRPTKNPILMQVVEDIHLQKNLYMHTPITEPQIINLPKILDERGNLSFFENSRQIPFEIKRTYWIYDVPGGETRGGHAFKEQQEFIVALSGSFDVVLHNGEKEQRFHLNRSYYGLYIPRMIWRSMENFSTNSLALIVSDCKYDEQDYIRDFESYVNMCND
jgi:hypothetical protein